MTTIGHLIGRVRRRDSAFHRQNHEKNRLEFLEKNKRFVGSCVQNVLFLKNNYLQSISVNNDSVSFRSSPSLNKIMSYISLWNNTSVSFVLCDLWLNYV